MSSKNGCTKDWIDIGQLVCGTAEEIFEKCGAQDDFCIQHVGMTAVFGGVNRLIFSTTTGWRIDSSSCSPRFRENWDRIKSEYCGVKVLSF